MLPHLLVSTVAIAVLGLGCLLALRLLRHRYSRAFSLLEVELDRRYNLALKLLRATQAHLPHDADVLLELVNARGEATRLALDAVFRPGRQGHMEALMQADTRFNRALDAYLDVLTTIPDVRLDGRIHPLLTDLQSTNDRVIAEQTHYNQAVASYNQFSRFMPFSRKAAFPFLAGQPQRTALKRLTPPHLVLSHADLQIA